VELESACSGAATSTPFIFIIISRAFLLGGRYLHAAYRDSLIRVVYQRFQRLHIPSGGCIPVRQTITTAK
jgi:hypothetical protein